MSRDPSIGPPPVRPQQRRARAGRGRASSPAPGRRCRCLLMRAALAIAGDLRPCPVENTRARADSLAGTSTTGSPSKTSRCARCRPTPAHPSTAHTGPAPPTRGQQLPVTIAVGAETPGRQDTLPFVEDLNRRRPLVRVHPDHHTCQNLHLSSTPGTMSNEEGSAASSWADPS
jgi:hypothetical protein